MTQGLWQRFFEDLRLCLLLITPVLAARLFAEERRLGTMELLQTYPLTEVELVCGKCLSLVVCFLPLVLLTALFPLALAFLWPVDPWPLVATYLGALLLGGACLACGTLCSALATQQTSAVLSTFGLLFLSWFLAWNEAAAGPTLLAILRRLSLFDRFYDFTRGTVQSQDVIYFLMVMLLFVWGAVEVLRWQWQQRSTQLVRMTLLVVIGVGVEDWGVRHNRTWELVQEKESLLAPETLQTLAAVSVPVKLLLFYEPGRYRETAYLAEKCRRASSLIDVQLIDLDRDPAVARGYEVSVYGTAVVEAAGQWRKVVPAEEQALVQAIVAVTDPRPRTLCVTTGHGEHEVATKRPQEDDEPASVGELFERLGYQWHEVMLSHGESALHECRVLLVFGPRHDFASEEVGRVAHFLQGGGNALFLLDPVDLPRLTGLVGQYGVVLGEEMTLNGEQRLYLRDPATVPVIEVGLLAHAQEALTAVLYGARRVGLSATDGAGTASVFLGVRAGREGLLPVGVAVETGGDPHGRMMVVGDSDFLRGALGLRASNRLLVSHILQWLEDRTAQPSPVRERYAYAPLSVRQARFLFWTAMCPALGFLAMGGIAWRRRRSG